MSDARVSKPGASSHIAFSRHVLAFARALRTAGIRADSSKIALALEAVSLVGIDTREDVCATLECVLICREADRFVFHALFDAWFDAGASHGQPIAQEAFQEAVGSAATQERRRVRDAAPQWPRAKIAPAVEYRIRFSGLLTASDKERLRFSDFGTLDALEYREVQRLARSIAVALPSAKARRHQATVGSASSSPIDWPRALREGVRTGGELIRLPRARRRQKRLPLLALVDVSGSMERYARMWLAFLHMAIPLDGRRDVFAFGTHITDLKRCFGCGDVDEMLTRANAAIDDFAGGTRIGGSLAQLRRRYAHRFVGGRTIVVIITDGLETGSPEALHDELSWLKRRARCLLWLNPMMRFEEYTPVARGASALHRYADTMLAAHNLHRLEEAAAHLARLLASA
ncbi:hypothetical protein B0G57_111108 [Trinickia symbiotica]|uniref:VWA domain-containing protein n=1 Tax=Trinickia symbiotica TaxID=863227 RepID=A0A2N7X0Y0_9BURK|nr:VWA domain-containing protein [Trinickia symbiotica]PMS35242.1 VWA domain-containing protein [Trinickia symbiotica]PPK43801.1 hypothetical protein B0G57_111108 [Trinickia symbiotica]